MPKEETGDGLVKCICDDAVFYVPNNIFSTVLLRTRNDGKKFVRYREGAEMYSMSERKFHDLAHRAGAVFKIDKAALVNVEILDRFLEFFHEE